MSDIQTNLTSTEYEKKNRELRSVRKDLALIAKENQKLQSDLKSKNETINLLINQNFTELKTLQEKHEKLIESLSSGYDQNIKLLGEKYNIFKKSLDSRLKDSINTHYRINNEKIKLLSEQNLSSQEKIIEIQKEILSKNDKIKELTLQFDDINKLYNDLVVKCKNMELDKKLSDQRLAELNIMYENYMKTSIDYNKEISDLNFAKEKIETELFSAKQEILRSNDTIMTLKTDTDQAKNLYYEIHNKHLLLLNDNVTKQNNIDEKTLEILSLNSKLGELEKKNLLLESNRKDINVKVTDLTHQIDNLQSDVISAQNNIRQLKIEKDVLLEEKEHHLKEIDQYKQKFMQLEAHVMEKINQILDKTSKEKEKYISDYEKIIAELNDRHEKNLMTMQSEYNANTNDKEKQIEGLMNHLKSYAENQHIAFNEMEKHKLSNEKLRLESSGIEQKTSEIHTQYKKELEDQKNTHKKEKEMLIESYNENIKKSQELNDALQNRLNQTIEALGLSKTAISNLKETNQTLERQLQTRETEDSTYQEKFHNLRSENASLRDKLERSVELNNTFSSKEKHYESQIRQLHNKYAQLVALTKKGMNSVTQ